MPLPRPVQHRSRGSALLRRSADLGLALLMLTGSAADPLTALPVLFSGTVTGIADGMLVVTEKGAVRLAGIALAEDASTLAGTGTPQLAPAARSALEELALDRTVVVHAAGAVRDRYGRWLGQVRTAEGTWLQGALLARGLARVQTASDSRAAGREMLALEAAAREAGRGAWGDPAWRVLRPEETGRHVGSFQLVAGRIRKVAYVQGVIYLNFGADWRNDFTVVIEPGDARQFRRAGLDPGRLEGRRVLVRGWIERRNGPLITATHPEQVVVSGS